MTDQPPKRVFSRPPVDGTDEELDAWADSFADAVLGAREPTSNLTDPGPLLAVDDYDEDDYPGDIWPTEEMIEQAEWLESLDALTDGEATTED